MKVIICENYEEASQKAADIMLEVVKNLLEVVIQMVQCITLQN